MISIFAIPKPFAGHIDVIQRNAVQSWRQLRGPDGEPVQVILVGDEPGVKQMAAEVGVLWIPHVQRNSFGTPLLSDAFARADEAATYPWLCYVNCDVMLTDDLPRAVASVRLPEFLGVARRWNIDQTEPIDFYSQTWQEDLTGRARRDGRLDAPMAIDCFVLPRGSALTRLPPFAVGRPGWDNWMLYRAWSLKMPIVDLSATATLVHQNHGYNHVPGQRGKRWEGPEADANRRHIQNPYRLFTIDDASHRLDSGGAMHSRGWKGPAWHLRRLGARHVALYWPMRILRAPFVVANALREGGLPAVRALFAGAGDETSSK